MTTCEDLTGQTFGRLTVLGPAEDYVAPGGKRFVQWLCRCVCGNLVTVAGGNLKSGRTRSCGCLQKEAPKRRREDLTGRTFGKLTVLGPAEDYVSPNGTHYARWLCRCECGNQVTVMGGSLKSGRTRSCGCLQKEAPKRRREDLTGQTFGKLTVLGPAEDHVSPDGTHISRWLCRCECGNQVTVAGGSLKSGGTRSCGCLQKETGTKRREDLTGRTFGRLTVLERKDDYVSPGGWSCTQWLCRCECGNLVTVRSNHLKSGSVRSCGCLQKKAPAKTQRPPRKRAREDLTGQTFGRLTVLGRAEDYVSPGGWHSARWLCRCECGNQVTVAGRNLKSGVTRSCGCLQKDVQRKRREDLTGRTFGRLTVLGPAEDHVRPDGTHISRWLCRCECGNQVTVLGQSLKSGNTKSCGCLQEEHENLTGRTFGRLTVLGPAEDYVSPGGRHSPRWFCRCECGNQVTVLGQSLKSGSTKSCGCLKKKREDLTGQTFGLLTVLGPAEDHVNPGGQRHAKWLCRCECGNQVTVLGLSLKSGSTRSCGCLRKKRGHKPR